MDGGRRHIDPGYARRHNETLEQELQTYHERRCAEWPAYKRCIEKRRQAYEKNARMASQVLLAMADCQDREICANINKNGKCPELKLESVPDECSQSIDLSKLRQIRERAKCRKEASQGITSQISDAVLGNVADNPLSALAVGALFITDERLKELDEENEAWKEIYRVEEEYDRKMIKLSGFEW